MGHDLWTQEPGRWTRGGWTAQASGIASGRLELVARGVDGPDPAATALALLVAQALDDPRIDRVDLTASWTTPDGTSAQMHREVARSDVRRLPSTVALGLSGGGLRATGFQLGVLHGLHGLGLLPRVTVMSGISGGALLVGHVVGAIAAGWDFPAFLTHTHRFLAEDLSVDPIPWPRDTTLIRRAARYYSATLPLGGLTLKDAAERLKTRGAFGLEEAIFSATEMSFSRDFTFAIRAPGEVGGAQSGTHGARLTREQVGSVDVGEAMAASSAFPIGFSPMIFSADFRVPLTSPRDPLPLTDGGVHDNQGIQALLRAVERVGTRLDLVMLVDADPSHPTPALSGETPDWARHANLWFFPAATFLLTLTGVLVGGAAGAVLAAAALSGSLPIAAFAGLVAVAVSFLLVLAAVVGARIGSAWIARRLLPAAVSTPFIPARAFLTAGMMRARMVGPLLIDTFMARSRRLHYESLFRAAGRSRARPFDALAVLITDLPNHAAREPAKPDERPSRRWRPGSHLTAICARARAEATTLRLGATPEERRQRASDLEVAGRAALYFKVWTWCSDLPHRASVLSGAQLIDPRLTWLGEDAGARLLALEDVLEGRSSPQEPWTSDLSIGTTPGRPAGGEGDR